MDACFSPLYSSHNCCLCLAYCVAQKYDKLISPKEKVPRERQKKRERCICGKHSLGQSLLCLFLKDETFFSFFFQYLMSLVWFGFRQPHLLSCVFVSVCLMCCFCFVLSRLSAFALVSKQHQSAASVLPSLAYCLWSSQKIVSPNGDSMSVLTCLCRLCTYRVSF